MGDLENTLKDACVRYVKNPSGYLTIWTKGGGIVELWPMEKGFVLSRPVMGVEMWVEEVRMEGGRLMGMVGEKVVAEVVCVGG